MTASTARRMGDIDSLEERTRSVDVVPGTTATSSWRLEVLRPSREMTVRVRPQTRRSASTAPDYRVRALALWPRLDSEKLRRTRGDLMRIARLVERRTACSLEMIIGMLTREVSE